MPERRFRNSERVLVHVLGVHGSTTRRGTFQYLQTGVFEQGYSWKQTPPLRRACVLLHGDPARGWKEETLQWVDLRLIEPDVCPAPATRYAAPAFHGTPQQLGHDALAAALAAAPPRAPYSDADLRLDPFEPRGAPNEQRKRKAST